MSDFFVRGNVTIQDSELVAGPQADAPTNEAREVTGASDYVVNLFGERLYIAGRNGVPDGFEQPFHSVDLVYSWYPTDRITFKAKLQNILREQIEIEREGVVTFEEDPGSTFAISFQWAAF